MDMVNEVLGFLGDMLLVFGVLAALVLLVALALWGLGIIGQFTVEEGTGTAFKLLGGYSLTVMSLKGFRFGLKEFIEVGIGSSSTGKCWCILRIGGWVFYLKWFAEPTSYTDQNNDDGFGKGFQVFLNQIQKDFALNKAETKKGEEIPLNLKGAFKMKVVNIYLFLFVAPKDVIAKVIEIMEAIVRAWIKNHTYDEIQEVSSNGGKMWDQFGTDIKSAIRKVSEDWGVEILQESIAIMDIGLQEEDQKFFAEKKRQRLKTAAGAQELFGGMLENAALSLGIKDDDKPGGKTAGEKTREELQRTPEGKQLLTEMLGRANQVVAQRALGVKPFLVGNADGSPLDPITAGIASLISLMKGNSVTSKESARDDGGKGKSRGGSEKDKDILSQDPSKLNADQLKEYEAALQRRNKRRKGDRTDEEDE